MSFNIPKVAAELYGLEEQDGLVDYSEDLIAGVGYLTGPDGQTRAVDLAEINQFASAVGQRADDQDMNNHILNLLLSEGSNFQGLQRFLLGEREASLRAKNAYNRGNYERAVPYLIKAAEKGDPESQYSLGLCYYQGRAVEKNYPEAYKFACKSAEAGYHHGAFLLAQCLYTGNGCKKNIAESFKWAELSHERGSEKGTIFLANFYYNGEYVQRDYDKAFQLYLSIEHSGDHAVYFLLGRCYMNGYGCPRDYKRAFELFKIAETVDDPYVNYDLGLLYYNGHGTEIDYNEAIRFFEREQELKAPRSIDALVMVGRCHYYGQGRAKNQEKADAIAQELIARKDGRGYYALATFAQAAQDPKMAFHNLTLAVKLKFEKARAGLGAAHFYGEGTPVNYKEAFKQLKLVNDDPDAFQCLGFCYLDGLGTPVNIPLGIDYLTKSAEQNNDQIAQIKLGHLYFLGDQVAKNHELSESYYLQALQGPEVKSDWVLNLVYLGLVEINLERFFRENCEDSLNKSLSFARKVAELNLDSEYREISERMKYMNKTALKSLLSTMNQRRVRDMATLTPDHFARLINIDLFCVKHVFDYYFIAYDGNRNHPDFRNLKVVYNFLYSDLDRNWDLLPKEKLETLMKLIFKITGMMNTTSDNYISKAFILDLESDLTATPEEVAESFLPVMPKKKPKVASKPKGAQKKASPKQTPTPPVSVPVPALVPSPVPVVAPPVKASSPPKVSAVKGKQSSPVIVSKETKRVHKVLSIVQIFKEAQEAIIAHYTHDVSSSLRKSIAAVFNKESLSQDKVLAVMRHIAHMMQGEVILNANGGARLIVGELSVGFHAFHGPGDKNHLGFIADLRKLMVALYQRRS